MPLWGRKSSPRAQVISPAAAAVLMQGGTNYSGEHVTESSALSLSAVWRAVLLVSGTIAGLPLKTYTTTGDDERRRVPSFFDSPAGPYRRGECEPITGFEWAETNVLHLMLHGEAPLLHVYNNANTIVGTQPIHPLSVSVEEAPGGMSARYPDGRIYWVTVAEGRATRRVELSSHDITIIPGPISNGLRGMSFLSYGRNSLGISLAAERQAATMFGNGPLLGGFFSPAESEDLSAQDVDDIRRDLDKELYSRGKSGMMPIINKVLKFTPWQMTNLDAQFLESRQFQIEEVSRWTGVPPHLLMQLDKQTSWGSGIAESNKNLSQYVLVNWTRRIEGRCSRLLPTPRFVEFDYAGLEAGSAKDEIDLLLRQVNGGFITPNEGRRIRNLPPFPTGGDEVRIPSGVMLSDQLEAAAAAAGAPTPTEEPA